MVYLPNTSYQYMAFLILDQKWLKWRTLSPTSRSSKLTPTVVLLKSMRYVPSVERASWQIRLQRHISVPMECTWGLLKGKRRDLYYRYYISCMYSFPFPDSAPNLVEVHDKCFTSSTIISTCELIAWPAGQSSHQRENLLSPCPSRTRVSIGKAI